MKLFLLWFGLTLGNFTVEWFKTKDWPEAMERSYYQGVALLAAWFMIWGMQ